MASLMTKASTTMVEGPVRAIPTSCPVPGLTEPSLVFHGARDVRIARVAVGARPDPTCVSELWPIAEQVVTSPLWALSHGRPRHCPPTLMSWKVQETQRRVRHRHCSVLPDRALEECMACAPVLDEAAIRERLVAVDLGQPSWGSAKSSQQAYSDSTRPVTNGSPPIHTLFEMSGDPRPTPGRR